MFFVATCERARWRCAFAALVAGLLLIRPGDVSAAEAAHPVVMGFERFHTIESADKSAGGQLLLGELNCIACHKAEGVSAALLNAKAAPVLSDVARRVRPEYLAKFLVNPHEVKPGTTMPNLLASLPVEEQQAAAEALTHFLMKSHPAGPEASAAPMGGRARGEQLYHTIGCAVCHGSKKEGAMQLATSQPLGKLDDKYTLPSLAAFLQDPLHVRAGGRMPSFNLTSLEARDLASYLLPNVPEKTGLAYAYYEGNWDKLPDFDKLKPAASGGTDKIDVSMKKRNDHFGLRFEGALQIDKEGEYTFHVTSDDGTRLSIDGVQVVENDGVHPPSTKSGKIKLTKGAHLVRLDYFEGAGGEELALVFEGPGVSRRPVAEAIMATPPPVDVPESSFVVDDAKAVKGRELFATIGCASCHTLKEKRNAAPIASTLSAPPLAKLNNTAGCLHATVPKGAPNYGLHERQVKALAEAIQILSTSPPQPEAKQSIASTMKRLNCYACHERDGVGGIEDSRLELFTGTQPEMGDEGRLPPHLNGVGGKLTAAWFNHIMADGAKDRPYMNTRMPKFGAANAGHLPQECEGLDKLEPLPHAPLDLKEAKQGGWTLVGDQGFGCIKCHTFGRFKATGVQSIDMTIMNRRLREEWFRRYVDNPIAFRPGTRMPDAWPSENGVSLLKNVLDGKNDTQIEAVWLYLNDGLKARTPKGLTNNSLELLPTSEAIIYRNFIEGAGPRAIGVGFPEHYSLAFDANQLRLALLWQGSFIDASKHWEGRGPGFQRPAGDHVLKLPEGATFAQLESDTSPWPTTPPKENGYKFRGYRLSADERPTFMYSLGDVLIDDFTTPVIDGAKSAVQRTLTLTAETPPQNLYFRAAEGQIEPLGDEWFNVGGEYRVRLPGGKVREVGGRKELVAPVKFDGKKAVLVEEFDW